ncbi:MAG TPA: aryl-sulfate sulfotransferase [Pirellulales bacterium]|nr:aryl-sulfate sulfotransferase [Pirellulales bacterium]
MWFRSRFDSSTSRSKRAYSRRNKRGARRSRTGGMPLQLERLEDRCLLSGDGVSLTPSGASPQLVGESITWTAATADLGAAPVYQFRVGPEHGPLHVVRDFSLSNSFTWTPMEEGSYDIEVIAKQGFSATGTESADVLDVVNSRVTGAEAVITPTSNPLVALYSVPPTQPGPGPHGTVHVEFAVAGNSPSWQNTNDLPSLPGRSTNFLVAGMLPDTTYEMRDVFSDGAASSPLLFTTGAIPSTVKLPSITVPQPPGPGSDLDQGLVFQQLARSAQGLPQPYVTDLSGNVVWYYDPSQAGFKGGIPAMSADLLPGGTVLVTGADSRAPFPYSQDILREIDLAGDPVRETNLDAVNAQLTAMGYNNIDGFTHDATRLPNGQTAVIGLTERTVNINGTPTNYVGADIIVLDRNFQVAWVWDSFDHLDVNRGPVLGETVKPGVVDPDAAVPNLPAVDWLHANSVDWSPADGNLTLSIKNQDWVIKIDYRDGEGDGHVIWRLGQGGDFTVNSTDPNPWFSGQHDAHYIDDDTLIVFDDGDTRRASDPTADSRGQVWKIDQRTMTATLVVNADMGNYSDALGSAQRLSNGDYSFDSGRQGVAPHQIGQSIEVRPDGSKAYVLQVNAPLFRAFRIQSLYEGVSDQLAGESEATGGAGVDESSGGLRGGEDGGADNDATSSLELIATDIVFNQAIGGAAGSGGSAGQGVGGGLYVAPGGVATADDRTVIFRNYATTSDDDVFGVLGACV